MQGFLAYTQHAAKQHTAFGSHRTVTTKGLFTQEIYEPFRMAHNLFWSHQPLLITILWPSQDFSHCVRIFQILKMLKTKLSSVCGWRNAKSCHLDLTCKISQAYNQKLAPLLRPFDIRVKVNMEQGHSQIKLSHNLWDCGTRGLYYHFVWGDWPWHTARGANQSVLTTHWPCLMTALQSCQILQFIFFFSHLLVGNSQLPETSGTILQRNLLIKWSSSALLVIEQIDDRGKRKLLSGHERRPCQGKTPCSEKINDELAQISILLMSLLCM